MEPMPKSGDEPSTEGARGAFLFFPPLLSSSGDCNDSSEDAKTTSLRLNDLPDSLLLDILSLVTPLECRLRSCLLVCKRWYRLCLDRSLWKAIRLSPPHSKKITNEALAALLQKIPSTEVESLELRCCTGLKPVGDRCVPHRCCNLRVLELVDCWSVDDAFVAALVLHCPNLGELVLRECLRVCDRALTRLAGHLPRLRRLELDDRNGVTETGMEALTRPRRKDEVDLEKLSILNRHLRRQLMGRIVRAHRNLKFLRAFCLAVDRPTSEAIAAACKDLEHLIVHRHYRDREQPFKKGVSLKKLTGACRKLATLQLYDQQGDALDSSPDCRLEEVAANCPRLESLTIDGSLDPVPTGEGIETLTHRCRNLKSLELIVPCRDVDDDVLKAVAYHLEHLEVLRLPFWPVTDVGVAHVARSCEHLRTLHLGGPFTDESARALAQSPAKSRLRVLALDRAEITDEGLIAICSSLPLTGLALHEWTQISGGGVSTAVSPIAKGLKALLIESALPQWQTLITESEVWKIRGMEMRSSSRLGYTLTRFFSFIDDKNSY